MKNLNLQENIKDASQVVGTSWPLYSFVTSNPLSGYEKSAFAKAVQKAQHLFGATVFPSAKAFKEALNSGEINEHNLQELLEENGFDETVDFYMDQIDSIKTIQSKNPNHKLDRIVVKWLSAFLDEDLAEWDMPNKHLGFYKAWRSLAIYDSEINVKSLESIPESSEEALQKLTVNFDRHDLQRCFEHHIAALPGWAGYIKFREQNHTIWQQAYVLDMQDYLAVRLWISHHLGIEVLPKKIVNALDDPMIELQHVFLKAWEKSWQDSLIRVLEKESILTESENLSNVPDAQMAFCIDTRSELIRRNVEAAGNYETFGYAGFFGIAMDYTDFENGLSRKSCPPIVGSAYQVSEIAQENKSGKVAEIQKRNERSKFTKYFLTRMKNMLPSAFGYVEGAGLFYGFSLISRTLFPAKTYHPERTNDVAYEKSCSPVIHPTVKSNESNDGIPLNEKVAIVKSAFDLTGWNRFAPIILFVGHGSHSANNPFGSSLDCGACAASPGRHNARMLAKMANIPAVRASLKEDFNYVIPTDTIFIGAEHNTTTDEIVLFDAEVPESHQTRLKALKEDLKKIQETAAQERLAVAANGKSAAHKRTNNWSETRPEWGLAKNAGFIVGPRSLTADINLDGNCFLHSYNWELDTQGKALEGIMQGPMVVTQWINNHYYFSTVDNEKFGGGSKITHNITGRYGVVQGNGGDLKFGLPLQSVNESDDALYHKPLRLSVLIQAPVDRIQDILERNENLKSLLDNEWIYLMVMDPTNENIVDRYTSGMEWVSMNSLEAALVV